MFQIWCYIYVPYTAFGCNWVDSVCDHQFGNRLRITPIFGIEERAAKDQFSRSHLIWFFPSFGMVALCWMGDYCLHPRPWRLTKHQEIIVEIFYEKYIYYHITNYMLYYRCRFCKRISFMERIYSTWPIDLCRLPLSFGFSQGSCLPIPQTFLL